MFKVFFVIVMVSGTKFTFNDEVRLFEDVHECRESAREKKLEFIGNPKVRSVHGLCMPAKTVEA